MKDPLADLREALEELTLGAEETWQDALQAVVDERDELLRRAKGAEAEVMQLKQSLAAAQEHVDLLRAERPTPSELDEQYQHQRDAVEADRIRVAKQLAEISSSIREKEAEVLRDLQGTASTSASAWTVTNYAPSPVIPEAEDLRASLSVSSAWVSPDQYARTISPILDAVDRLRAERDALRRSLDFARNEYRFTVADLEERLARRVDKTGAEASLEEVELLTSELDEARTKVGDAGVLAAELAAQNARLAEAEETIVKLQNTIAEGHIAVQNMDPSAPTAEAEATSLRTALSHAVVSAQDLSDQLFASQSALSIKEDLLSELTAQLIDITSQRDALQIEVDALQVKIANSNPASDKLMSDRVALALQVSQLRSELNLTGQAMNVAQTTIANLREDIRLSTSEDTDETILRLRAQRDTMEARAAECECMVEEMRRELARVGTDLKLAEERIGFFDNELDQSEATHRELEAKVSELEQEQAERVAALQVVEDEKRELQAAVEALQRQEEEHAGRIGVLLQEKEAAEQAHTALQAHIGELQSTIAELQVSNAAVRAEQQLATEELGSPESAPVDGTSGDELVPTIAAFFAAVHQQRVLKSDVSDLNVEVATLRTALDAKSGNLEASIASYEAAILENVATQHQLTSLKVQQAQSTSALTAAQGKIAKLSDELSTARTEVEIMLERVSKVQSSTNMRSEEAQTKVEQLEKSSAELQARLAATEEELQAAVQAREQVEQERERIQSDVRELERALAAAQQEAAEGKGHETVVATFRIQLEEREKEIAVVRESFQLELLSERETAAAQRQEFTDTISALEFTISSLEGKNTELEVFREKATEFDGLNQQLKMNVQAHAEESKGLREELSVTTERMTAEMTRAEQLERQLVSEAQAAKEQQEKLEAQLKELGGQLGAERAANAQLSSDLAAAKEIAAKHERAAVSLQFDAASSQSDLKRAQAARAKLEEQLGESTKEINRLQAEVVLLQDGVAHAQDVAAQAEQKLSDAMAQPDGPAGPRLAELSARIEELEDQLRKKSTEVEEADDKMIEILKEKKKLQTRVDVLNKKLTTLQTKLQAAKEAGPAELPASKTPTGKTPMARTVKAPIARTVSTASEPSTSKSPAKSTAALPSTGGARSFNRTTSVPVNIFGNTNDAALPPPVFTAAHPTPIPAQISPIRPLRLASKDQAPPEPIIGQKRRMPSEFQEPYTDTAYVPVAAPPKSPAATLRKIVKGRTGFTPVRSPVKRPVSDITNLASSPAPLGMKPRVFSKALSEADGHKAPALSNGRTMSAATEGLFNQISHVLRQH
ncbi:hypothetical protein CALCODRAFT_482467 [Calocera cornea HHB12733]|uniref:Uncharacterized protein n=1 Tax=Calocera cornea HHB12733 TaxID=1353952 RepID=A0A165GR90_9BASI|nr:hypothetical protein CALCODRAFT_482467 [Calocera cornea HHB12733]